MLQHDLDRQVDLQNSRIADLGSPSRCRRGCDACCHNWVDALPEEARAILEAIRAREGAAGVAALVVAANEHVAAARAAGNSRAWFLLRRPCLFLRDGACTVYAQRPFTCRAYHVTSEPADCSLERPGAPVIRVNHLPAMRAYLDHFGSCTDFLPALVVAQAEDKTPWT
ncbi:YkgJ family cysteine cluster protein [Nannocystis sp. ILAH1]|uniref:YkgJ family cysteine cluster protein n=2 Tax=Nannocystis sp. ILAH1 TaxID=2996789 RepID=UPI00226EE70D|nr:YkgJ family cysteine cluster protein [Nannocystis sp. ILAH1]